MELRRELMDETYKLKPYSIFYVYEPKKRRIVSTRIRDRVFQRSLCDNYFYKAITKSFVYDNCACQIGKGTNFARDRLKVHLSKFYRQHGTHGYVLKIDLKNYFGSTPHWVAKAAVRKRVHDEWAIREVERIIDSFSDGENPNVGMGLGSQVTQLIELAVLDDIDHYIKEQLRINHYLRYMDDLILIHESKEYLRHCLEEIEKKLAELELNINKKKTQIFPIYKPIKFLGFSFILKPSGKIVMLLAPRKLSHERRKLKKLVDRACNGKMTRENVHQCFISWSAHASNGNTFKVRQTMKQYYQHLWEVKFMFEIKTLEDQLIEERKKNVELQNIVNEQADALIELAGIIEEMEVAQNG